MSRGEIAFVIGCILLVGWAGANYIRTVREFKAVCIDAGGKPLFDGRQWACIVPQPRNINPTLDT